MEFDFTDYSDSGFRLLKPGRYPAEVTRFLKRAKENGNTVFHIELKVTPPGGTPEYVRYFQTVSEKEGSLAYVLRMFQALGLLKPEDRPQDGPFRVKLDIKKNQEDGEEHVVALEVNGEKRPTVGVKCIAIVTNRNDPQTGEARNWVERIERISETASRRPAINPDSTQAPQTIPSNSGLPF